MSGVKMTENQSTYTITRIPPEGGWGYLIGIGMALPFICALSSMPSFGLMFGDFLSSLNEETSAIALITSCYFSALSFAGLFTNSLFRKFSIRSVGVAGGALYFIGSLMTVFVTSVNQLLVAFSIIQGAGFGLMIPAAYTTFNAYFVEKRVMMMSIAQTLIGVGTMGYPIMVQILMDLYGFRGCMAVIAAVNGHAILGMMVMHPVQWHMKEIRITTVANGDDEEEAVVLMQPKAGSDIKIFVCDEEGAQSQQLQVAEPKADGKLTSKRLSLKHRRVSDLGMTKSERSHSLDPLEFMKDMEMRRRRASSISSLGNWTGAVIVSDASENIKRKNGKWQVVVDFLDLTLLKDLIYVNMVLGISFALYSDVAFFTLQPLYLFELQYSKTDTAIIIAIGAAADLGSRVFLAVTSACVQVKARTVYLAGAILTIFVRFAFLCTFDFTGMCAVTAAMGFLRTWLHVPLPLVFAEYLPEERFPSGYGLFMFLQGNIMFAIGPFIGWIRDATQSYEITFHCLTVSMALCAFPWLLEMCYSRMCGAPKQSIVSTSISTRNGNGHHKG